MISFAVFLFSVCSAARIDTWDSQTLSLSDFLRRLNDLEHRLEVQERINGEQEMIIKTLNIENKKLKNVGMPETDKIFNTKKQNEDKGLTPTFRNKTTTGKETMVVYREHLSNSNLKSKISVEQYIPGNCCGKSKLNSKYNEPKKRSVTGGVAFYSYLSRYESKPGQHQTIIFDNVITNIGGNYNRHTGTFFCPVDGVYTFSWTLFCSSGGYIYSEIVVNSNAVGAMHCDGRGASGDRHSTGVVVVEINQGDVVYIRTNPGYTISGSLPSSSEYRSSFSGWKLF